MTAETAVHAEFTQPQPLTVSRTGTGASSGTVTSTAPDNSIDCGSVCGPTAFPEGSDVTLHAATATAHQTFDGWSGGGCSGTDDCTVTMDGPITVTATFTQITHSLTAHTDGDGSGTVSAASTAISGCTDGPPAAGTCADQINEGDSVTLSATAILHSTFAGWSVAGQPGACSGLGDCTVSADANTDVTATFTLNRHDLNVTVDGNGSGDVDADARARFSTAPNQAAPVRTTCLEGTPVTLTATPGAHSSLAWSGDCDLVNGDTCTTTVDGAKNVTATFTLITHTLAVSTSGSGSVSCDGGACASSYVEGTTVTLAATPAAGNQFDGWSGACAGAGGCTVTLNADAAVGAAFSAIPAPPAPTPPATTPPTTKKKLTFGKCVKNANKTYKKLLKKAKRKHGKARAKAIKAAKRKRGKLINRCKVRFHKKKGKRHHKRHGNKRNHKRGGGR